MTWKEMEAKIKELKYKNKELTEALDDIFDIANDSITANGSSDERIYYFEDLYLDLYRKIENLLRR